MRLSWRSQSTRQIANRLLLEQTRVFQIAGVCYDLANRNPLPAMLPFFSDDVAHYFAAICLFWLVIVPPGFVLGWSANLLGFRSRWPLFRLYAATAIGLSVFPVLMHLCWSLGSIRIVWALYGVFWAAFIVLLVLRKVRLADLCPPTAEFLFAAGWILLCGLIILDLRTSGGVYINWASGDHSFRTSVINAIRNSDVLPASNPFFNSGHPIPFRYHYFWFMLAAFVEAVGGGFIGPRDALFASIAWSGLALVAVASLFLLAQDEGSFAAWRRRTWLAAGLMSVTGLDLIPFSLITFIVSSALGRFFLPLADFESWNSNGQVTSWLGSCIWVPNHVGGLICGCTGVLLILSAYRSSGLSNRITASIAAGLAFASSAGCSVFVVFVFLVALTALFVAGAIRRNRRLLTVLTLSGMVAVIAALPYLLELNAEARGTPFAVFRPRTFIPAFWFINGTPSTLDARGTIVMLLCLPLNFGMELGFFLAVGFYKYKKARLGGYSRLDKVLVFLLISGMLIGSFLSSVALPQNDLGWRAMLVVQFVLLLWAVEWAQEVLQPALSAAGTRLRGAAAVAAMMGLIGVAGTAMDATMIRIYGLAIDHGRGKAVNPEVATSVGSRTAELRAIYTEALKNLPVSELVQENPLVPDPIQQGLYSTWASAARGREYGPSYGGDPAVYFRTEAELGSVFGKTANLESVANVCANTRIGAFVVQDFDPTWGVPDSWIWSVAPVYSGKHTRAFTCADILRSAGARTRD